MGANSTAVLSKDVKRAITLVKEIYRVKINTDVIKAFGEAQEAIKAVYKKNSKYKL